MKMLLLITDISDVQNKADPLAKVKAGLQGSNKEPVPLKSVHIRGKMLDMVAQVGFFLSRKNFVAKKFMFMI